jgi:hypothetical protein
MATIKVVTIIATASIPETDIPDTCRALGVYGSFSDPILEEELTAGKEALTEYFKKGVCVMASPVIDLKAKNKDSQVRAYLQNKLMTEVISSSYSTSEVTVPD